MWVRLSLCASAPSAPLHRCTAAECCPQWLERGNLPWPPGRPACFLCLLCIACSCSVLVPVLLLWLSSVLVLSPLSVSCSCCLLACLPRLASPAQPQASPAPSPALHSVGVELPFSAVPCLPVQAGTYTLAAPPHPAYIRGPPTLNRQATDPRSPAHASPRMPTPRRRPHPPAASHGAPRPREIARLELFPHNGARVLPDRVAAIPDRSCGCHVPPLALPCPDPPDGCRRIACAAAIAIHLHHPNPRSH